MFAFCRPGGDLLSRVLRQSTIGAGAFHGRVRNGNGCGRPAMTTRSAKGKQRSWSRANRQSAIGVRAYWDCLLVECLGVSQALGLPPVVRRAVRSALGA